MRRNIPILFQADDVFGCRWDVCEVRNTKHGFDLLFGKPLPRGHYDFGGPLRLILTKPLMDFWDANRIKLNVVFDLPAGRTTLKRARRSLGFHYTRDNAEFWSARLDDLQWLSTREFARRHKVGIYSVNEWRRKLVGRRLRKWGWWRTPDNLQILQSNLTLREIAQRLSISTSHAHRLRECARRDRFAA